MASLTGPPVERLSLEKNNIREKRALVGGKKKEAVLKKKKKQKNKKKQDGPKLKDKKEYVAV